MCVGRKENEFKKGCVAAVERHHTLTRALPHTLLTMQQRHVERGAAVGVAVVEVDASPSRRAGGVELGVGAPAPRGGGGGQQGGQ